jgi:PAS domain S-box-containing protein
MNNDSDSKKFERIIQFSREGILTLDKDDLTDFVNWRGALILGYRPEEMIGRPLTDFIQREEGEITVNLLEMRRRMESEYGEWRMRHIDGSDRWVLYSACPLIDSRGIYEGALVMFTDISERKRLEEELKRASEARYRALFENNIDAVFLTTPGGDIISANPAACYIFQMTEEELKAMGRDGLVINNDQSEAIIKENLWVGESRAELTCRRKDGTVFPGEVTSSRYTDADGSVKVSIIIRDSTERKKAEEAQKRYAEELARSNEELQQFAYVASHDLKEPLRMVSLYIGLLDKKYGSTMDQRAKEYMDFALKGTARMYELIEDLLEYSRVDSRRGQFSSIDMNKVVEEALIALKASISETQSTIEVDKMPVLMADKSQMIQLMQNLIGNAIKFRGQERPRINISARECLDHWQFAVKDNGIGIDMHQADRIFEIFHRLHSDQEYAGTGIGLAIAKKIVERHGGRIWLESNGKGTGSTFFFTVPKSII